MNIFVVEDSQSIRRLLVRRLEALEGARVVGEAVGESQAVALIEWLKPDTVLLDLSLASGGSGLQVLTQLRRSGFTGRVLVLTHQALDAYRDACMKAGADGFYDKASGLDTLLDDLGQMIEREPPCSKENPASNLLRDGLTGLFGETALLERLDQAAKMAQRDGVELAVYVMLLQGLEALAQEQGSDEANALLRRVAGHLREACEPSDVLARHAPDQFSLVLTRVESASNATAFATYLSGLLNKSFTGEESSSALALRAQVGVALFPGDAVAPRSLLTLAEAHAYGAMLPQAGSVFVN